MPLHPAVRSGWPASRRTNAPPRPRRAGQCFASRRRARQYDDAGRARLLARRVRGVAGGDRAVTFNKRAADELGERVAAALAPLGLPPTRFASARSTRWGARSCLTPAGPSCRSSTGGPCGNSRVASGGSLRRLDDGFSRLKLDLGVDTDRGRRAPGNRGSGGPRPGACRRSSLRGRWREGRARLRRPGAAARWSRSSADAGCSRGGDDAARQLAGGRGPGRGPQPARLALLLPRPATTSSWWRDDDQTIYAWRLADVRRVLDLAASLPDLRRVDLVTNYRCPPAVVARAVRLVEHNRERFAKTIRAGPSATGRLYLLPDSGDDVARARRLFREWHSPEGETRAILARTNAELAPYAAVALECGIPYRAADDGLLLDDPALDDLLEAACAPGAASLFERLLLARASSGPDRSRAAAALLAWAPGHADVTALGGRRGRSEDAPGGHPPGRCAAAAGHRARHQGPRVRSRGGGRPRRGTLPERAERRGVRRSRADPGRGTQAGLRRVDAGPPLARARLRPGCAVAVPARGVHGRRTRPLTGPARSAPS